MGFLVYHVVGQTQYGKRHYVGMTKRGRRETVHQVLRRRKEEHELGTGAGGALYLKKYTKHLLSKESLSRRVKLLIEKQGAKIRY